MPDEATVTIQATEIDEAVISAVHMLRGSIITSFSHVEFLFTDLYYRSLRLKEYNGLSTKLPYTVKARVNSLKRLFALPGPLNQYEPELLSVVDQLRDFEQLRQYIAHGLLVVYPRPDGVHRISFRTYFQPKGSGAILGEMSGSLDVLHAEDNRLREYDNKIVLLIAKIYLGVGMPEIGAEEV